MPLGNLIAGQPFKVAVRALLVFLAAYVLASTLLLTSVHRSLTSELRAQTEAEIVLLRQIYISDGRQALINALKQMDRVSDPQERVSGLFDPNGLSLTGPISIMPDFVGIQHRQITTQSQRHIGQIYLLNTQKIDTLTLVEGRNMGPVQRADRLLLIGLTLFGLIIAPAILGIGLWASRTSFARLQDMETALARVSAGDLDARLPVLRRNDQFDRVSAKVNQNLDQLSRLVAGVRATASSIAHDLKTPLSHTQIALHEAAEAAEKGEDPRAKIEAALLETDRLNQIFDTMLRISRIRASTETATYVSVDLTELLHKSVDFLAPLADAQKQTVTLDAQNIWAVADAAMLEQAAMNLIKNAIDHAGQGAQIRVTAVEDADRTELSVIDNGPGIPVADIEQVQEPFFRLDSARSSPGSGLGLALVRAVANHHHGQLELVDAEPGLRAVLRLPKRGKEQTAV